LPSNVTFNQDFATCIIFLWACCLHQDLCPSDICRCSGFDLKQYNTLVQSHIFFTTKDFQGWVPSEVDASLMLILLVKYVH